MRDSSAAPYNPPAPQAPARNPTPTNSLLTFNSHRRIRRKLGDKKVYRPVRRHTLSRIDEAPQPSLLTDFSSTRPILRSRSNISADTSRSVPVCNQSQDITNQMESSSPQYAEPGTETDSSYDIPASMTDLPAMIQLDPAPYYPQYAYYTDDGRINGHKLKKKMKKLSSKHSNLYLAFMY